MSNAKQLPLPTADPSRRSPVSWRSVGLGLLGTILVCGFAPFNDLALNNTHIAGSALPTGLLLMLFLFVLLVNGPLWVYWPRAALTSGELTVAMAMILASCAIPGSGLMRYFASSLVVQFWHARWNNDFMAALDQIQPVPWMFPSFHGAGPRQWANDPLVTGYYMRWPQDEPVPYWTWIRPALAWGVFLMALFGAIACIMAIVRRQWNDNERLSFPLAQIQLALLEQPQRGRWLNSVLRTRSFWIGFGAVFLLHFWNGLAIYFPKNVPAIPLTANLASYMTEMPLNFMDDRMKWSTIYFSTVAVTYFLSGSLAFSLWFMFLLTQVYRMMVGSYGGDAKLAGRLEMHLGAVLAMAGGILWVGRKHWGLVLRQAFRGSRADEPRGRYLPYPLAFWGLILCLATMVGWMCAAGSSPHAAIISVGLLVILFVVIARITAETGLMYTGLMVATTEPMKLLGAAGMKDAFSLRDVYLSGHLSVHHNDFRETFGVYASHGLKAADRTIYDDKAMSTDTKAGRSIGRKLILVILLAMAIGFPAALFGNIWTQYKYAATLDIKGARMDEWGADNSTGMLINPTVVWAKPEMPKVNYSRGGWFGFGLVTTVFLTLMRLRFAWWPLHPIAFVLLVPPQLAVHWLGILLGWVIKTLVVRFGGATAYSNGRPFFLGVVIGESVAAGFWLLVTVVLYQLGIPYQVVRVLPT